MTRSPALLLLALACAPAADPVVDAIVEQPTPAGPSPYGEPAPPPRRYLGRANVEMYTMPVDPPCMRTPVGDAHGAGAKMTQIYQSEKHHLGEDWVMENAPTRGAPVFAMAPGRVIDAWDYGSTGCWGQVVRIAHRLQDGEDDLTWYESLYAHLETMEVELGQRIELGERLGTMGDASCYGPHLHWEVRTKMNMAIGQGYGRDTTGYTAPSALVDAHRCEVSPPPTGENPG